jgi:uncharacterized membrane protein YdjX (TVP38/TMEM64 family)
VRWRPIALVALIAALAVTAALLPLHRIPDAVAELDAWAPVVGVLVAAALLAALIPRTAISIACGALFGALGGGFVALAAALLAAAVTFAIGRALGRDAVAARAGSRWSRLDAWLSRRGLLAVTVVRMMPIAPYGLVGYAYGTTSVRRWHYALGTLIGATPSAFTYAAVGAAAVRPGSIRLVTFLPAAIGLLITVVAAVYWRYVSCSPGQRNASPDA